MFRSLDTLRQSLARVKQTKSDMKKKLVCEVPCSDHECVSIGEYVRRLEKSLTKHRTAVKTAESMGSLCTHVGTSTQ